jgi:hypothetical protein
VAADATCAEAPASLSASEDVSAEAQTPTIGADVAESGEPVRYATPAAIDCRVPVVSPLLLTLVGECDGVTLTDASYRASRFAESEMQAAGFFPSRQDPGATGHLAVCGGVPAQPSNWLPAPSGQPLALFAALPQLPPLIVAMLSQAGDLPPLSAQLRRLERPPRA